LLYVGVCVCCQLCISYCCGQ